MSTMHFNTSLNVQVNTSIYPIVQYKMKTPTQKRFDAIRARILCIGGTPGVGKSKLGYSLATYLSQDGLRSKYFPERINNDHLMMYLDDKTAEAHAFQECMVTRRLTTYWEAVQYAEAGGFAIVDGPITTDNAFELWNYQNGYIDERHHTLYCNMVKEFGELHAPDFIVYLDCSPTTSVRRLSKRQNFAEMNTYTSDYYTKLRHFNTIVTGNMRIATIPYDTDYPISKEGLLDREAAYDILDDILARVYENDGIVEQSLRHPEQTVITYESMVPIHLVKRGNIYVPVSQPQNTL